MVHPRDSAPDERPSTDGYTVTGGRGGIAFGLQELEGAAQLLDSVAAQLEPLQARLAAIVDDFALLARSMQPYPAATVDGLTACAQRTGAAAASIRLLSDKIRTAQRTYATAEEDTARRLAMRGSVQGWLDGYRLRFAALAFLGGFTALPGSVPGGNPLTQFLLQQLAEAGSHAGSTGLLDATEQLMNGLPEVAAGAGLIPGGWPLLLPGAEGPPGMQARNAASVLAVLAAMLGYVKTGRVRVSRVGAEQQALQQPTLAAMFAGVGEAYAVAPSAVIVRRVTRAPGATTWVVDIPGTEDWSAPDTASTFDLEADLQGLAGQPSGNIRSLVEQALADSGARSQDPIILNSHSGGGICAAAMVADPAFLARHNVRMLNVAGAPIANFRIPDRVDVLAVQNVDDAVAGLDGRPNPAGGNLTTVTSGRRPRAGSLPPLERVGVGHSLSGYQRDAAVLDASTDPSVLAHKEQLARLLGADGTAGPVRVSVRVYQGTDAFPGAAPTSGSGTPRSQRRPAEK